MVKIFIIEDQPRNMRLIEQIVLDISDRIELVKASSGLEALEAAKQLEPALVLMDIALPDMDGIQITNILRKYRGFETVPFIAVTAYATAKEKDNISKIFDYYISKPIDEDIVIDIIKRVLGDRI